MPTASEKNLEEALHILQEKIGYTRNFYYLSLVSAKLLELKNAQINKMGGYDSLLVVLLAFCTSVRP